MFRRCWRYYKKYWKIANPSKWLIGSYFVGSLLCNAAFTARPFVAALIIGALVNQDAEATYVSILVYLIVLLVYRITDFATWRIYSLEAGRDNVCLHEKVFGKLANVDSNFTHEINKGRFMNTVNNDLFNISEIGTYTIELMMVILQIPIMLVIVGVYNIPAAGIIVISGLIYFAVCNRADRKFNKFYEKKWSEEDKYSNLVGQVAEGLQEVKAFNMLPRLRKKLDIIQNRYNKYYKTERHYATVWGIDSKLIFYAFQALLYVTLAIFFMNGWLELNALIMVVSYHETIIRHYLDDIMSRIDAVRTRYISLDRIEDILNYQPKEIVKFGRTGIENLRGEVEFKNVSLKIQKREIVKQFSLKIKPREIVAIVGPPGSGKTTVLDMLLRLQQPTRGKILLDDIDVNEFSREIYTSSVAVANQMPFVFNISIRDNLDFANMDVKAQIEACKTVGIHNFIETLPQGYNTILRENASNVSGGQKQMISIARTILTDAEVLLLDDITTSLDPDTATFVPKMLKRLKNTHTIIMVTKKPELMQEADRIVVLNQGKIEAIGTHKTLIKKSKTYQMLQFAASGGRSRSV